MKFRMCRIIIMVLVISGNMVCYAQDSGDIDIGSKSAFLMEANTGEVLYEYNCHETSSPASVTKVMTLLLTYEAIANGKISLEDDVTISEHAASFGGSTILLDINEKIKLKDIIRGVVVASGNDGAVALSEYVGGTEETFVKMMNEKAKELGMNDTNFVNPCGLDADGHVTSAHDIAIMSRELITKYPQIVEYSTIYDDRLIHQRKNGQEETQITNTNKLIKWYDGATGLKTGFTRKALYSISATAQREGLSLIAVAMASPTRDARTKDVVNLLNYGFANYQIYTIDNKGKDAGEFNIKHGDKSTVLCEYGEQFSMLVKKNGNFSEDNIEKNIIIDNELIAPINKGQNIGKVVYNLNGKEIGTQAIIASEKIEERNFKVDFIKVIQLFIR